MPLNSPSLTAPFLASFCPVPLCCHFLKQQSPTFLAPGTAFIKASQVVLVVKNPPANAGDIRDMGLIPGSGRCPREGNDNPLQYSWLENPMNRGAVSLQSMGSQRVEHDRSDLAAHNMHWFHGRQFFHGLGGRVGLGMIQAHLLCTLFLLLLHQLHLRSSGIRPNSLQTSILKDVCLLCH